MEFTTLQIAQLVNGTVNGDKEAKVNRLSKIQEAKEGSISFLSNPKYENFIYTTEATAVIISKDFKPQKKITSTLIKVKDPYHAFSTLLDEYHKIISFQKSGIEEPSFIGKNVKVGEGIYRGAFSYVGNNSVIGNNVKLYPNVYVGDNVKIGDNTIIHAGAKLYSNTVIGSNCVLHAGVVVGSDGFGFAPQEDGSYKNIPQIGNVIVEDHVDIGANTVIDCATFESTIIRRGAKLDNLIQVAHNVEVGENTAIAAQTGVSGSTIIGRNAIIAGQVGISGHIHIGDKAKIAAQSGIMKSVGENKTVMGSPAFDYKDYLRSSAIFKSLPDLNQRLKELEEKILNLPTI